MKSWEAEKIHALLVGLQLSCGEESGIDEIKAIYISENSILLIVCFQMVHYRQMYKILITVSLVAVHTHTLCIYIYIIMHVYNILFIHFPSAGLLGYPYIPICKNLKYVGKIQSNV